MKYCVGDKKVFPLCLFSVNPPKKSLPDKEKCASAKFSGIFPTEKMALQNFPAIFKPKKWLCKIFQRFSN